MRARRAVLLGVLAVGLLAGLRAASPAASGSSLAQAPAVAPSAPGGAWNLPLKEGSVRFAVLGDTGRGDKGQYETAERIVTARQRFPFTFAILVGDNIYGADAPSEFEKKFERPYKALIDAGVKFYASIGNHDNPNQRFYKFFNMGGERYYTFRPPGADGQPARGVRFFAVDSNYLDKGQIDWLEKSLAESGSDWKICYFHHPLYSSAKKHGSSLETRAVLEPMFVKHSVDVVFAGHDHAYERIKSQKGVYHWVVGSTGSLRPGDLAETDMTEVGYDEDYAFLFAELFKEELHFLALTRKGQVVDSGVIRRPRPNPEIAPTPSPVTKPVPPPSGPPPAAPTPSPLPPVPKTDGAPAHGGHGVKASPSPAAKASPKPSPRASPHH